MYVVQELSWMRPTRKYCIFFPLILFNNLSAEYAVTVNNRISSETLEQRYTIVRHYLFILNPYYRRFECSIQPQRNRSNKRIQPEY